MKVNAAITPRREELPSGMRKPNPATRSDQNLLEQVSRMAQTGIMQEGTYMFGKVNRSKPRLPNVSIV